MEAPKFETGIPQQYQRTKLDSILVFVPFDFWSQTVWGSEKLFLYFLFHFMLLYIGLPTSLEKEILKEDFIVQRIKRTSSFLQNFDGTSKQQTNENL